MARGVRRGFKGGGYIVTAVHLYMSEVELELALGTEYGNRTMAVYVSSVLAGVLLLCVVSKTRSTIICVGVHH